MQNPNKKTQSGSRYLALKSEWAGAEVITDSNPQTICIEFQSEVFFKPNNKITLDNILSYINDCFRQSGNSLFTQCATELRENVYPKQLRNDIIIIFKTVEGNNDYYFNKFSKLKSIFFRFEIYIHTSNCLQKDSCQIKFFPDQPSRENEDTKSVRNFCNKIINSEVISNNKFFFSKKIAKK
jgi:hypothetical protein